MFTTFDSHLPAVETGLAHASIVTRGRIQADAPLARRIAP
jgi:hypothetical protein